LEKWAFFVFFWQSSNAVDPLKKYLKVFDYFFTFNILTNTLEGFEDFGQLFHELCDFKEFPYFQFPYKKPGKRKILLLGPLIPPSILAKNYR